MFDIYNVVIFPKEGQPRPTMINTRSEVVLQEAQTKIRACGIPHALILVIYGVKAHRSTLRTYAYILISMELISAQDTRYRRNRKRLGAHIWSSPQRD